MVSFAEPERLSVIFDSPQREEWQKSRQIIARLGLTPTMRIADVGAGTGYFSRQFAALLPKGRVYAIDSEPNMVAHMRRRFADEQIGNIEVRLSEPDHPALPADLDWVFLANVYRFIPQRQAFLAQIFAGMPSGARLMLVDLATIHAHPSPDQVIDELKAAGFELRELDMHTCPTHYLLQARKP